MTIRTRRDDVTSGRASVRERVVRSLEAIRTQHPPLNAFVSLCDEMALADAEELDRRASANQSVGTLAGSVVAVKDCIDVRGTATTSGLAAPWTDSAISHSSVVQALRQADAVVIGKTNLDEWAFGIETSNERFGATLNPRSPARSPGGSSGGSAAAVAVGYVDLAIGTDTGGSTRIPASYCGVAAMKVTQGSIDLRGVQPLAPSFDTIGFFVPPEDMEDLATIMRVLSSDPSNGPLSINMESAAWRQRPVGVLRHLGQLNSEVRTAYELSLRVLRQWGMKPMPIEVPTFEEIADQFLCITLSELASGPIARRPYKLQDLNSALREAIEEGGAIPATRYIDALRFRERLRDSVHQQMDASACEFLLTPTTPSLAPLIDEARRVSSGEGLDAASPFRFLLLVNMLGDPAVVMPVRTPSQLAPSMQLVGRAGSDLDLAAAAQQLWAASHGVE